MQSARRRQARRTATGGNGAAGSLGGTTGAGGAANSTLSLTGAVATTANANATGGNGGGIAAGSAGFGANGGAAAATSSGTSMGAFAASSTATATGGNAGAASSGPGGNGGNATATANASGTAAANATATATGGAFSQRSMRGAAIAQATASGASGTTTATALSGGGLITTLQSQSSAPTSGETQAFARAGVGAAALDASAAAGVESVAYAVGSPAAADIASFFAGNPNSQPHFNLAGDSIAGATSEVLGLVTMGGAYAAGATGSRTYTSSATFAIDLSSLSNPRQDLIVALLDTNVVGAGFDSMQFQIQREGVNPPIVNQTFNSVAAANAFLSDNVINLGSNGVVNVSGDLNLVFSLSLTTNDVGAGFSFDLLFGNSTFGSADFDVDGDVDGSDFLTWQRGFGVGTTKAQGDANADSVVNGSDLDVWKNQYGFVATSIAAVDGVPEPMSASMMVTATLLVVAGRRFMPRNGIKRTAC